MKLLAVLFAMSLTDCLFTLVWVEGLGAEESNPLLAALLQEHGFGALAAWKLTLTAVSVYILGRVEARRPRTVFWVAGALTGAYVALNLIHFYLLLST